MSHFERALNLVLMAEGGYVHDPADSGGRTRYGITEAVARAHGFLGPMHTLPLALAEAIYQTDYWDATRCDDLPWPLCAYVFDCAVNQGADVAVRLLQAALGTVQDGIVGPQTLALAKAATPWHQARFLALRAQRYIGTRGFDRFGQGWLIRVIMLAREAA